MVYGRHIDMKQTLKLLFGVFIILNLSFSVSALDIGLQGSLGNLAFDSSRESALSDTGLAFTDNLYWNGTIRLEQPIADTSTFSIIFNRDAILQNSLYTTVSFDTDYAKIAVGPFFGLFNSGSSLITSGLTTTLTMALPGVLYGTFRSDTTIGAGITVPGDYVQQKSEMAIGFWGPNTLTSFRLSTKTFTLKKTTSLTTVDTSTQYDMVTEVFKKNVPYTATITLGYQSLKRSYLGATTTSDELAAIRLGCDAGFRFSDTFTLVGGGHLPLYTWGVGNLQSPTDSTVFYEATLGFIFSIDTTRRASQKAVLITEPQITEGSNNEENQAATAPEVPVAN